MKNGKSVKRKAKGKRKKPSAPAVSQSRDTTSSVDPLLSGCEVSEVKWSEVSEPKTYFTFYEIIYVIDYEYTLLCL